jgi:hypothetical protein
MIAVTDKIVKELKGISIFPTIGNHDMFPFDR